MNWSIGKIGQFVVQKKDNQFDTVVELLRRKRLTLGDVVPVLQARPTTSGGRMLSIVDRVAFTWSLPSIQQGLSNGQTLLNPLTDRVPQLYAALALRVPDCFVVDRTMEKVVANQLVFQSRERMRDVGQITLVQSLPIDEIRATDPTAPALFSAHLLELLKAVQVVFAIDRRALDVKRR